MRSPMTHEERAYVRDLIKRLGSGHTPMLPDWFRSQELVEKYLNITRIKRKTMPNGVDPDDSGTDGGERVTRKRRRP